MILKIDNPNKEEEIVNTFRLTMNGDKIQLRVRNNNGQDHVLLDVSNNGFYLHETNEDFGFPLDAHRKIKLI